MKTLLPVRDYALGETLSSGQAFRWRAIEGAWEGVVGNRWVRLKGEAEGIRAEGAEANVAADWNWLKDYLQTETDLDAVIATFPQDEHMRKAVRECAGL